MINNKTLIKGAKLLDLSAGFDFDVRDILIVDDRINSIERHIEPTSDMEVFEGSGYIVSPGFIDIHTHVFIDDTDISVKADDIGVNRGVTSLFDAGSQGPENFEEFLNEIISKSTTSVYSLMNISKLGLKYKHEIDDLNKIDGELFKEVYLKNKKYIKGMKVRASASTVGEMGIAPIELAKKISKELNLPMVVHIGNFPPHIDEVMNLLEDGDIVTHAYHGKPNGMFDGDKIRDSFLRARERGVLFDIGHGSESFNFNTFKKAIILDFYPDIISTDLHIRNISGPVYSLQETINKVIGLGLSIEECIKMVTTTPAKALNLTDVGSMKVGYIADLTLFRIDENEKTRQDSEKNVLKSSDKINIEYVVKNGKFIKQNFIIE